jgi:hypothetical protein
MTFTSFHSRLPYWKYGIYFVSLSVILLKIWPSLRFTLGCPTENMAFISFHSRLFYWKYGLQFASLSAVLLKIWHLFRFTLSWPTENMAVISFHSRLPYWKYGIYFVSLSAVLLKIWPSIRFTLGCPTENMDIISFIGIMKWICVQDNEVFSQMFLINCLLWLHLFLVFCWYTTVENFYWWLYTVNTWMLLRSGMVSKHFEGPIWRAHSVIITFRGYLLHYT